MNPVESREDMQLRYWRTRYREASEALGRAERLTADLRKSVAEAKYNIELLTQGQLGLTL